MSAAPDLWQKARNLLCVRLDSLGDVLMTTPAIRALKDAAPGRRITLLASSAGAQAARYVPDIDRVLPYDAPWMKPPTSVHVFRSFDLNTGGFGPPEIA